MVTIMNNLISNDWQKLTRITLIAVGMVSIALFSTPVLAEEKKEDDKKKPKITFDEHIKPIFRAKCFACHNTDKKASGLDLTNYTDRKSVV